jgi:hypothetical protein
LLTPRDLIGNLNSLLTCPDIMQEQINMNRPQGPSARHYVDPIATFCDSRLVWNFIGNRYF